MTLKIAAVGCGHIMDHRHLPAFQKIENAEVVAICDIDENTAKHTAEKFRIKNVYTDIATMMKNEDLDIVDICTPPKSHLSLSTLAMESGSHVLVEKPLVMNLEEYDKLNSVSNRTGVTACVVHQNIYNTAVLKAKHLVDAGYVGDILSVESSTLVRRENYMVQDGRHWCHNLPGGIFFELLPHPLYLLQMFLEGLSPLESAVKKLSEFEHMKTDELRTVLDADNGIGIIVGSCNSPYHGDTLNIFGTKSSLQVDLWGRTVLKLGEKTEEPVSVGVNNLKLAAQSLGILGSTFSSFMINTFSGIKISAHYNFLKEYVDRIENGDEPPVSMSEARENVVLVEQICQQISEKVK